MNWFERYVFKKYLKRIKNSNIFEGHVVYVLRLILNFFDEVYYEDNQPSKDAFLRECCNTAIRLNNEAKQTTTTISTTIYYK